MGSTHTRLRFVKRLAALTLASIGAVAAVFVFVGAAGAAGSPDCAPSAGGGNLCVLDPSASNALLVQDSSSLSVARSLVVDSSSATAAATSNGGSVSAAAIGGPGGFSGSFSPVPVAVAAQPDPFAGSTVAHATCSGGASLTVSSGTQSAAAGTYSTLGASSGGTLDLGPGVYTITGAFSNTGTVEGTGVTIYLCPGASVFLAGSSSTTLSSPSGPTGFVIFSDSDAQFSTFGVTTNLVGAVYARLATASLLNLNVQGDVVFKTLLVHSGGVVTITAAPPKSPSIATQLSAATVTAGGTVNDTATLTGASANAGGTVTYTVYTNSACTSGARDAGTKTVTNGAVPPSNSLAFTAVGTYYWQAVYSGDAGDNGATSPCTSEQLVVAPATPALSTTASGPVTVGSAIHDTAHLTGGSSPTGTITFDLYDSSCTTKLASLAATATVSGAGDYTSASFTPAAAGTYKWVAHYSGDANNTKLDSACNDAGETSTVNAAPPSGGGGGGGGGGGTPTTNSTPTPTPQTTPQTTPVTQPSTPAIVPAQASSKPKPKVKPKAKPKPKPFKPPVVKPKHHAKPAAAPCYQVSVSPKSLAAGSVGKLNLHVTAKSHPAAGVKIQAKGPGILTLSGRTNSAGKVTLKLHPKKPGIVAFHAVTKKGCNTARVGVVGAFTPPVTG
jgi:hypothetical protein